MIALLPAEPTRWTESAPPFPVTAQAAAEKSVLPSASFTVTVSAPVVPITARSFARRPAPNCVEEKVAPLLADAPCSLKARRSMLRMVVPVKSMFAGMS